MTDTIFLVKRTSVILHFCALALGVQSPRTHAFVIHDSTVPRLRELAPVAGADPKARLRNLARVVE